MHKATTCEPSATSIKLRPSSKQHQTTSQPTTPTFYQRNLKRTTIAYLIAPSSSLPYQPRDLPAPDRIYLFKNMCARTITKWICCTGFSQMKETYCDLNCMISPTGIEPRRGTARNGSQEMKRRWWKIRLCALSVPSCHGWDWLANQFNRRRINDLKSDVLFNRS